jgi:hypothetical protein
MDEGEQMLERALGSMAGPMVRLILKARLSGLLCVLALVAGMPAHATAQSRPLEAISPDLNDKIQRSHLLDPEKFGLRGLDPEQLFKQELNRIHAREILDNYKNENGNGAQKLGALIQKHPDLVQDFLKGFHFRDLPEGLQARFAGREKELEEFIHSLKLEDLQKYAGAAERLGSVPAPGAAPSVPPPEGQPPGSEAGAPPAPETNGSQQGTADPSAPGTDGADQPASSALGQWLLKAAERLKEMDPSLRDSPALHRAIRELSRKIEGSDERWKALDREANAIADKWASLGQALPLDRLWPEKGFAWTQKLLPHSLPDWKLPEFGSRSGQPAPFTLPHGGMPTLSQENGWSALWMLAMVAGLGLILWKLWTRSAAGRGGNPGGWKLGPWPVQPAAVRTRDELIRAFEYLSVLRLGPAARHWHHWAIASALGRFCGNIAPTSRRGEAFAELRRSAEELASLYERARYAPPDEPLPEAALATARRDLCLLAGVPVS